MTVQYYHFEHCDHKRTYSDQQQQDIFIWNNSKVTNGALIHGFDIRLR
jgi:hypothetical protein